MKPAASVLLLTTLTGFGYGLLAWLALFALLGLLPGSRWFMPVGVVVALGFAASGLIASMLHLGRPERAWRAFSQWRSSWLSREGVASLVTFPPALGFAALWWVMGPGPVTVIVGLIAAALGLVTVYCTAMIYASLKPIRQWNNKHTAPNYMLLALFSGAMLLALLLACWTGQAGLAGLLVLVAGLLAAAAKLAYWRFIDTQKPLATLASATGLKEYGAVRPLDAPHFTENYVLREMGYQIARKHAAKLRRITLATAFLLPALLALLAGLGLVPALLIILATLLTAMGLFIERWLFFAEATHVATLYYGR
nr:DmsC/YnfH family molybdoenzyme membrane anchor subunit [uncultured Acidocella sp.]